MESHLDSLSVPWTFHATCSFSFYIFSIPSKKKDSGFFLGGFWRTERQGILVLCSQPDARRNWLPFPPQLMTSPWTLVGVPMRSWNRQEWTCKRWNSCLPHSPVTWDEPAEWQQPAGDIRLHSRLCCGRKAIMTPAHWDSGRYSPIRVLLNIFAVFAASCSRYD